MSVIRITKKEYYETFCELSLPEYLAWVQRLGQSVERILAPPATTPTRIVYIYFAHENIMT